MRSKQQPRPSFRWPQQRGDNLTGKYPYVTSHAPTECAQWFFGSNLGWVLQSHQPIFEGPSMSSRPSEETSVDAQASSPFTALICRTGVLISTRNERKESHSVRTQTKEPVEEEVLNLSPFFAQNLNGATRENISYETACIRLSQSDKSSQDKIIRCLFSLCRSEYQYNPFFSFYLRF
ncbi:hypothetical protein ALC62_15114 [Cyphomyrmex costatus]|uniref:Uncharacterized protein n=1 Tax=Cyphomyrmex costatus TaxID=456900 RepID=A0A151I808_9HYME|nr:hypothetical protein ALC62_15114 [Cyphomyrmex costatus]